MFAVPAVRGGHVINQMEKSNMKNAIPYTDEQMAAESERRRPGITALVESIRGRHPGWSEARVMSEAKTRYTNGERAVKG